MSQIWQWLAQYQNSIPYASAPHQQMMMLYELASLNPREGIQLQLLKQARQIADDLDESCFSLFLAHWMTEHYLWKLRDYKAALENALDAVLKYRHQRGNYCPLDDRLYINLVEVYTEIDPAGYRKEIEDSLQHVEQHIEIDYESRCMIAFRRGLLHARLYEGAAANEQAAQCLQIAESAGAAAYYHAIAYYVQALAAFNAGDMSRLSELTTTGATVAQQGVHVVYLPEFMMWAAVAELSVGSHQIAERYYHEATRRAAADIRGLSFAYYDAHSLWFAQQGHFTDAIALRETQYERISGQGRNLDEVELWLDCVALLKRAELPTAPAITRARAAIATLKQPSMYEERLTTLLSD